VENNQGSLERGGEGLEEAVRGDDDDMKFEGNGRLADLPWREFLE
jgi:hypothetical protein